MNPARIEELTDKRYIGKPCGECGNAVRLITTGHCITCMRARTKTYLREARNTAGSSHNRRRKKCARESLARQRKQPGNRHRIKFRARHNALQEAKRKVPGSPRWLSHKIRRKARRSPMRTPIWADKKAIRAIYREAKERGLVVDHIVPLNGELVCGLHVEYNLQVMTHEANALKSNTWVVE